MSRVGIVQGGRGGWTSGWYGVRGVRGIGDEWVGWGKWNSV